MMNNTQDKESLTRPQQKPANTDSVIEAHKVIQHNPQNWRTHTKSQIRSFLLQIGLCVGVPTLIAGLYFGLIAADRYQTEAHIAVRSAQSTGAAATLFGTLIGGGGLQPSSQDTKNLADFLTSANAVSALESTTELRSILGHPKADFLSRLPDDASFEKLVSYYNSHVNAVYDSSQDVVVVTVQSYAPEQTKRLADAILALSEEAINGFNRHAREDSLRVAKEEMKKAKDYLGNISDNLVNFRHTREEMDPLTKSGSILSVIANLEAERSAARIKLAEISSYMKSDTAEVRALKQRISAVSKQISNEQKRLTGKGETVTQQLADYERLLLEKELAAQAYTSALASLESARIEAQRQQMYVVPIVTPHTPETALYPERLRGTFLVTIVSLLIFGIGRLIIAGIKDHMMH